MKLTKKFWIICGLVLVALLIAAKWFGGKESAELIQAEKVEVRTIIERVSASGKIQPEIEVNITAEVSGQIIRLPVKEGDRVQKGDLLVQINPDLYDAALNRAQAAANSARSNLASAKAQYAQADAQFFAAQKSWERTQQLFKDRILSQADYDAAESSFRSAEATLTAAGETIRSAEFAISSAEASVQEARDNLSRTTLTAPQSGTVTALVKESGESVQGNGFTAGEVVMKVSDLSIMEVDAYLDQTFEGAVTEIGNTALNAGLNGFAMDQVTNFSVKVRLAPESYASLLEEEGTLSPFRPGMSAKVDILTREAAGALSIPIQSVTTREAEDGTDEETELGVFLVSEGDIAEWRVVTTGIQDNRYIEILTGLTEGDQVITGPYQSVSRTLVNGDAVEIKVPEEEDKNESANE